MSLSFPISSTHHISNFLHSPIPPISLYPSFLYYYYYRPQFPHGHSTSFVICNYRVGEKSFLASNASMENKQGSVLRCCSFSTFGGRECSNGGEGEDEEDDDEEEEVRGIGEDEEERAFGSFLLPERWDVLGLGQAMVDFSGTVDDEFLKKLGLEKGTRKVVNHEERGKILQAMDGCSYKAAAGGSLSNSLVALARLGSRPIGGPVINVAMAGSVGNDPLGGFYREKLRRANVQFLSAPITGGTTGTVIVLTTPDAQRTMLAYQMTVCSSHHSVRFGRCASTGLSLRFGRSSTVLALAGRCAPSRRRLCSVRPLGRLPLSFQIATWLACSADLPCEKSIMGKDKMKASWDMNTTKLFIDLCIEQVRKGQRKCTSFTKIGWDDIRERFNKMTGRVYHKPQFKNKYDSLRKDWTTWHKLLNETGVGWDNERNTVAANDEWWEKKIEENALYEKFRNRGLQFQVELAQLFENVAASGPNNWAPSSMMLPTPIEPNPAHDTQEGSGDSDDVVGGTTGMSGEFHSFTFNEAGQGSGGNNEKQPGTSAADKSTSANMTTSSLGVRRRGDTMKKKGPASAKIADALSMMVEEARADRKRDEALANRMTEEARANRIAEEARSAEERARAYEISIAGVMHHLKQVDEVVCDDDFYARCAHLLMNHPPAREVYAAVKDMRQQLLVFLKHECYGDKK